MVETLFSARSFIEQNGDLIISYGDIIFEQKNLDLLLNSNDEISLMIDKQWKDLWKIRIENPLEDAETLVIDGKEFITEIGKRPKNYNKIHGQYTGLIKVRSDKIGQLIDFYDTLDRNKLYDGKNFKNMYMTSFMQELINANWKVKAVLVNGGWLEIDSVSDLKTYEKLKQIMNYINFLIYDFNY